VEAKRSAGKEKGLFKWSRRAGSSAQSTEENTKKDVWERTGERGKKRRGKAREGRFVVGEKREKSRPQTRDGEDPSRKGEVTF